MLSGEYDGLVTLPDDLNEAARGRSRPYRRSHLAGNMQHH
jgi:hypothetical protein